MLSARHVYIGLTPGFTPEGILNRLTRFDIGKEALVFKQYPLCSALREKILHKKSGIIPKYLSQAQLCLANNKSRDLIELMHLQWFWHENLSFWAEASVLS